MKSPAFHIALAFLLPPLSMLLSRQAIPAVAATLPFAWALRAILHAACLRDVSLPTFAWAVLCLIALMLIPALRTWRREIMAGGLALLALGVFAL
jgi:branched-subunit amino acid transport protein AzlD